MSRQFPCGGSGCILVCIALFCLTMNILLTLLVVQDMRKRGGVNKLWILPLLLAGIPVTVLYALFRIGDSIRDGAAPKA